MEELGRTDASDEEWYKVPGSLLEQLECVEGCCDGKEDAEDDCCYFGRIVMVQEVFLSQFVRHLGSNLAGVWCLEGKAFVMVLSKEQVVNVSPCCGLNCEGKKPLK